MKKLLLMAVTLLTISGASAQTDTNFVNVKFTKNAGSPTGLLTYTPHTSDSLKWLIRICHDSTYYSGSSMVLTSPMDSGRLTSTANTVIPLSGDDTTICYAKIISWRWDTLSHVWHPKDSTKPVVLGKAPTLSVTYVADIDSIHYTIKVNAGNFKNVPVVITLFSDAGYTYSSACHTYLVSGETLHTITGSVPYKLDGCTPYFMEAGTVNSVDSVLLQSAVTTSCSELNMTSFMQVGDSVSAKVSYNSVSGNFITFTIAFTNASGSVLYDTVISGVDDTGSVVTSFKLNSTDTGKLYAFAYGMQTFSSDPILSDTMSLVVKENTGVHDVESVKPNSWGVASVLSINGEILQTYKCFYNELEKNMNKSELKNGLYILRFLPEDGTVAKPFKVPVVK